MQDVNDSIIKEASRCYCCKNAQCVKYCPLGVDIPEIMRLVKDGKEYEAYRLLSNSTLFGAICGVVCPHSHQCEGHCLKGLTDRAVAIGQVERMLTEQYQHSLTVGTDCGKSVAIVGAGVSGIACALNLRKLGIAVTMYEKQHLTGGVVRYGIPDFRLKKDALDKLTAMLYQTGVTLITSCEVGTMVTLPQLLEEFDAVYLATGLQGNVKLGIVGEQCNGVVFGADYLKNVQRAKHVVVVGGGNSAIDCARTALRHSQKTTLVYRRTVNEIPAYPDELQAALDEGLNIEYLAQPIEILNNQGKVTGIKLCRMQPSEVQSDGRKGVVATNNTFDIQCDLVVVAIGNNLHFAGDTAPQSINGRVAVDKDMHTSIDRVYAGGDVVNTVNTVAYAIKQGMDAANSIAYDLGISCTNKAD